MTNLDAGDAIDPDKIPVVPKLLATDLHTLVNCVEQLNASKGMDKIREVTVREGRALVDVWLKPDFLKKMALFVQSLKKPK